MYTVKRKSGNKFSQWKNCIQGNKISSQTPFYSINLLDNFETTSLNYDEESTASHSNSYFDVYDNRSFFERGISRQWSYKKYV